eukprot:2652961-Lingulodinium_polyedra.AAC.1
MRIAEEEGGGGGRVDQIYRENEATQAKCWAALDMGNVSTLRDESEEGDAVLIVVDEVVDEN